MSDAYILLEDGPESKRLRVSLQEFKNTPLLNLRYWYKDRKTGDLKPTTKGIALTRSNYLALRSTILDNHEEIMEYLNIGSQSLPNEGDKLVADSFAVSQHEPISSIEVNIGALKPTSKLFEVIYEGAKATVLLNNSHIFVQTYLNEKDVNNSGEKLAPIGILLASFDLALLNSRSSELTTPSVVTEQLSFDFSFNTKKVTRLVQ